jgi:hypothetical protein
MINGNILLRMGFQPPFGGGGMLVQWKKLVRETCKVMDGFCFLSHELSSKRKMMLRKTHKKVE